MRPGRRSAWALLAVGIFSLLNCIVASAASAERNFLMTSYVNTHWITTITVFASIAHLMCKDGHFEGEVFACCLNLLSLCISFASAIADFFNLRLILQNRNDGYRAFAVFVKRSHLIYSTIDFICCLVAVPLSISLLKSILSSTQHNRQQVHVHRPSLAMGTSLVTIGVLRGLLYLIEVIVLRNNQALVAQFTNYTLDEPSWIAVSIMTGVVVVLSARGSSLLRAVSLLASSALLWPALFYLWIDYRVLEGGTKSTPGLRSLLTATISLSLIEIGTLLATALSLISLVPSRAKLRLEPSLRTLFLCLSLLFLILSLLSLSLDLYTAARHLFYRVFHGTEQKTPFVCALLAILSLASAAPSLSPLAIPMCLSVCLLTANSTLFQLFSYIYLSFKGYFPDSICEFLQQSRSCNDPVNKEGVRLHFLEALVNVIVLALSLILCVALIRIARLASNHVHLTNSADKKTCRKMENYIRILGIIMETCALTLVLSLLTRSDSSDSLHPLVFLYGFVYHFSLALALVIFPLFQILCSENLRCYPILSSSLMCISAVRFVDILSQLDYRGTGDGLTREWRVHHMADCIALGCHFLSIVLLIRLSSVGRGDLPCMLDDIPTDFDNPLRTIHGENQALDGEGYVQLRVEETI